MDHRTDGPTSRYRQVLRRAGILAGTALVAAGSVGAVILATQAISAATVRIAVDGAPAPLTVATTTAKRQAGYEIPQEYIGRVEPRQESALGFEIAGTLQSVEADEGDTVTKGQVLATLDTRIIAASLTEQRAARDALQAQLDLARLTYERQQTLADNNYASQQRADEARLSVAQLEANIAERAAAVMSAEVQLEKGVLRAPYDGRIAQRLADEGAQLGATAPVFELQEAARPQVRIGLTPATAATLEPGQSVSVVIEGRSYDAQFASRASSIDPVTRTLPALFDLDAAPTNSPPYGAVARLTITQSISEPGLWLPLTALTEGPRGLWTVLLVQETATGREVAREAVELLYASDASAFVRGAIEDGAMVISEAPHRVAVGQSVTLAASGQ